MTDAQAPGAREPFYLWTIFDSPQDFPGLFVARRFNYDQPTNDIRLATTLAPSEPQFRRASTVLSATR